MGEYGKKPSKAQSAKWREKGVKREEGHSVNRQEGHRFSDRPQNPKPLKKNRDKKR